MQEYPGDMECETRHHKPTEDLVGEGRDRCRGSEVWRVLAVNDESYFMRPKAQKKDAFLCMQRGSACR